MSGLGTGVLVAVVVHALLTFEGCDFEACQESGSALHQAAGSGDAAAVRRELREGADPNREVDDRTPMECAIDAGILSGNGDPASVRALLDGGARPTQEALLDAVGAREVGIVEMLLDAGARASTDALHLATAPWCDDEPRWQRLATIRLLTEHGADPDGGPQGPSPLLCAAWSGRDDAVRLLLADGADPDHGGRMADWFVDEAVARMRHGTTPRAVLDLVPEPRGDQIADVPPLLSAVWGGDVDVARLLLDAGADPEQAADDAFTPILAAALTGDRAMVELLLGRGAEARPVVRPGVPSPAEAALRAGHPGIAERLS